MSNLAERVETRVRQEWPGIHYFDRHGETIVPPIREGGATDALISLVAKIIEEEES